MSHQSQPRDPAIDQGTPAAWKALLYALITTGRNRLEALGLTLVLGFALGALALFAFSHIADEVGERETDALDIGVLTWLQHYRSPALDVVARLFSAMGSEVLAMLLVLAVVLLARQSRWGAAGGLAVTTVGAQLLNNLLKEWFQRARPAPVLGFVPAQAFSFPSGHAMVAAAFYAFIGYLGWRALPAPWRYLWVTCLAVLVLGIGLSRLYLGVHYLTDVLAGYLAGFVWVETVIISGHFLITRRERRGVKSPSALSRDVPS